MVHLFFTLWYNEHFKTGYLKKFEVSFVIHRKVSSFIVIRIANDAT